jgi:hypothetical protein
MSITDQELAEKAADAVEAAIQDLAHERMSQSEQLEEELEGLTEEEQEAVLDRYEAAIRRYLPVQVYDVDDREFRPADESDD